MISPVRRHAAWLLLSLSLLSAPIGCSSVEIVRIQPDLLHLPKGTEPVAGLQATCMGFYLFTLGLPEADLDCAVNDKLMAEARKIGADRLVQLRFDVTPSHGFWFLTRLLWVRVATAWAIAVRSVPDEADDAEAPPAASPLPPDRRQKTGNPPASQPTSAPTRKTSAL